MKKLLVLSIGLFALTACNNQKSNTTENQEDVNQTQNKVDKPAIGGEKDDHGCLAAAGQSWSELRQSCIQIFEVGTRLNPVEVAEGETVYSAFAVFNDDKSKVEITIPDGEVRSVILDRTEGDIYQNEAYKFDGKEIVLFIKGEKEFAGEKQ